MSQTKIIFCGLILNSGIHYPHVYGTS